MLHPLSEDTSKMTVAQLHERIAELTQKYFRTNNPQLQEQLHTFIEFYNYRLFFRFS